MRPIRTAIVCNQIIPYRVPVFDWLASHDDYELKVIYLSEKERNREWNVERLRHPHALLPSISTYVTSRDWPIHLHWGLSNELNAFSPDVVVTMGYDSPGFWQTAAWAGRYDRGRVLYMGSTAFSSRTQSGPIHALRQRFVGGTDAFLAYGSWARDYLLSMGARWNDIFLGMNTVDIDSVRKGVNAALPIARKAKTELLYIGQLIERKGVHVLLDGLARLKGDDFRLHIVGSGPQEEALRKQAVELGIAGDVVFHGFKQKADLFPIMAGCDVLVMPSQLEVWGLVVNEALAAGLFVVAGQTAGAVPDLIRPGINGYAVDASSLNDMAEVLSRAMAVNKDRYAIVQSVSAFTPERTAERLAQAVAHAHRKHERVTGKVDLAA